MIESLEGVEEVSGFDEGPIHPNWIQELNARGIEVRQEVLRDEARDVLQFYRRTNGEVIMDGAGYYLLIYSNNPKSL